MPLTPRPKLRVSIGCLRCTAEGSDPLKAKRVKVLSQSLLSRLGGVSAFGFGVSFKAPEPERVVVRDVITALEDKRALYVGAVWEQPEYVVQSILQIRQELTAGLKRVGDNSPAKDAFRAMRAASREFLTNPAMSDHSLA
jgi:hypothetical protein